MVIDKNSEIQCGCGKYGCFETFASMKKLKPHLPEVPEEYINNLLIGINNLKNIFAPEVICLGGSVSYYEKLFKNELPDNIKFAKLKNDAGIIGAAFLESFLAK